MTKQKRYAYTTWYPHGQFLKTHIIGEDLKNRWEDQARQQGDFYTVVEIEEQEQ
jgi:hypothetical protein